MDYKNIIDRIGIEFEGLFTDNTESTLIQLQDNKLVRLEDDSTIRNGDIDYVVAREVKTAPLGAEELERILNMFSKWQQKGDYIVNHSCGLHYHISLKDNGFGHICRPDFYISMIDLFKNKYPKIWNDREKNQYCWADYKTDRNGRTVKIEDHFTKDTEDTGTRYHLVNYSTEYTTELGNVETVEIRFYGGEYATIKELKQVIQDTINIIKIHVNKSYQMPELIEADEQNPPLDIEIPSIKSGRKINREYIIKKETIKKSFQYLFKHNQKLDDINEVIQKIKIQPLEVVINQRPDQIINI
jgi:hypothetical protein